jgi:hypothetical protein
MKARMTLYYHGDPRRIEVEKPAGNLEWAFSA